MTIPILQAIAGIVILALVATFGEPVSLGSFLGVLLLVSALARYAVARGRSRA